MIHIGDCLEVMRTLGANSVDAIVTDPPYGLGFMGKVWDDPARLGDIAMRRNPAMDAVNTGAAKQGGRQRAGLDYQKRQARDARQFAAWCEQWAGEALRVAKPGAYLAAFGGTRMFHRLACAIEDAGWELRDCVPYAHEGVALEPVADCPWLLAWVYGSGFPKSHNGEWGGTALKPAWEPIVLARKPLIGTVEANWREHGTGALNIDGCRIHGVKGVPASPRRAAQGAAYGDLGNDDGTGSGWDANAGRWPANLIHDGSEEVVALFPQSNGQSGAVRGTDGDMARGGSTEPRGDTGSAARFFYCAKADRADRNDGCDGMPERPLLWSSGAQSPGTFQAEGTRRASENNHPTVKPTDLMRWLCRLVTPPGGVVLDPFAGSGSTGRGAIAEGMRFVGIELDPDYAAIADARIRAMQPGLILGPTP